MVSEIIAHWRQFLSNNYYKQQSLFTLFFTIINVLLFTWFMRINEQREGIKFNEPLLEYILPVTNYTWFIFTLTYISITLGIIFLIKIPIDFLKTLQAYNLLLIFRLISITLLPFEPPENMIPMQDPIIETIAAYDGFIYKDLFFSGHTATLFLFGLMLNNKLLKIYFYIITCIVAFLLVKQQVHYSVDVLAAPFFAYLCYYLIQTYWNKKETFQTQILERQ